MPLIRPVSDLRNNYTDVSRILKETDEPIFFTKNGYGDMVVMSIEQYEKRHFAYTISCKLKETRKDYTHEEVMNAIQEALVNLSTEK